MTLLSTLVLCTGIRVRHYSSIKVAKVVTFWGGFVKYGKKLAHLYTRLKGFASSILTTVIYSDRSIAVGGTICMMT